MAAAIASPTEVTQQSLPAVGAEGEHEPPTELTDC
jgi:hypothetical protein